MPQMSDRHRPIRLPTEGQIRRRLSTLATEANTLRALLRLIRRRRSIFARQEVTRG
jgi:hypothetical protein